MIRTTKIDVYRSEPTVNSNYDSVRVTLTMPLGTWRLLKKYIKDSSYFNFKDIADDK